MGYFSDSALNMTIGDMREEQQMDALDMLPHREPGDKGQRYYGRETRRAIDAAGKAAAVNAAALVGIEIGTTVRRKGATVTRGYGTGIVTHLYSECSHKFAGHVNGRRYDCDYKPRPYATIRWNSGEMMWGRGTRETVTTMPLSKIEPIAAN